MRAAHLLTFFLLALLSGCKNYVVEPESLKRQLIESTPQQAEVSGPFGEPHSYLANNIRVIECRTKDGQPHRLINSPAIEVRITLTNGKRRAMYFDRLLFRNDTLFGSPSRYMPKLKIAIPYGEIAKVEVQDGGKQFSYSGK